MKTSMLIILAALLLFSVSLATAQEEMTKEQWQQEIQKYTSERDGKSDRSHVVL